MFDFIKKKAKSPIRRIRIAPHTLNADGAYVPVTDTQIKIETIGDRRARGSRYAELLECAMRDYAEVILSDEDLEEAVYILTQYAKSRNYNIVGTSAQLLASIYARAEAEGSVDNA
jgi:hypothetical protein